MAPVPERAHAGRYRLVARALMAIQTAYFLLCVYGIVEAYTTPYTSEWLTGDAFAPFFLVAGIVALTLFWSTNAVHRHHTWRFAWLALLVIALLTLLPLVGLLHSRFAA
jgi:hypothetical protein